MSRRITALCLTVACSFAFASCSSSPSSSPDSDSSRQAAGADIPEGAKAETSNGATAFVSFWVDTLNTATESGETEDLKSLAGPGCTRCDNFAESLDEIYGAGGRVESEGWQILSLVPVAGSPEDAPGFQLNVQVAGQKVFSSDGAKAKKYKGGEQGLQMFLTREGDHWVVDRINI